MHIPTPTYATNALRKKLQKVSLRGNSGEQAGDSKRKCKIAQEDDSLSTAVSCKTALSLKPSSSPTADLVLQPPLAPGTTKRSSSETTALTSNPLAQSATPALFSKHLTRDEQLALLENSKNFILGKNYRRAEALSFLQKLSSKSFDDDFKPHLLSRRGLLHYIVGNSEQCVDDMMDILRASPESRSALVYCKAADLFDSFRVVRREKFDFIEEQKRKAIRRNTDNLLSPADGDIFARLVKLTQLGEIGKSSRVLESLESITQQAPSHPLPWSMLAAHCFFMTSFFPDRSMLKSAEDAACKALHLRPDDKLSISVLRWSGFAVNRKEEFQEAISWYRLCGGSANLYEPTEIGFKKGFDQVTTSLDPSLQSFFTERNANEAPKT